MKTWKKIEETKKRATDIHTLKKRKEEKIQKVGLILDLTNNIFRKYTTCNYKTSLNDINHKTII